MNFFAETVMDFSPKKEEEVAGLVLLQNHQYQFRMEYALENGKKVIRLIKREDGIEEMLAKNALNASKLFLQVEAQGQDYHFYYGTSPEQMNVLKEKVNGTILSTDVAGGFVGAYIGMYASSNGTESDQHADFVIGLNIGR